MDANRDKPSIILGNGVNIAFNQLEHNEKLKLEYKDILDELISQFSEDENITSFLNNYKSLRKKNVNLEELIGSLESSSLFSELFPSHTIEHDDVKGFKEKIVDKIKKLLRGGNLYKYNIISPYFTNLGTNLSCFKSIYTLNYDLILYWVINDSDNLKNDFKDGFAGKKGGDCFYFKGWKNTNCFNLHGGVHIFLYKTHEANLAFKVSRNFFDDQLNLQKTSTEIFNRINKSKSAELTDYLVLCHDPNEKLKLIDKNTYLKHAYNSLNKLKGRTLVIHGCSIGTNSTNDYDEHIWKKVLDSKLKDIFIGTDCEENKNKIDKKFNHLIDNNSEHKPTFHYYNQTCSDLNIWNDNNNTAWFELIKNHII